MKNSTLFIFVLVGIVGLVRGGPRRFGRDGEVDAVAAPAPAADVIQISDEKTPIVLDTSASATLSENELVEPRQQNETQSSSPSPVPPSVPITTEPIPAENTPNLVPSVVDISTPDPNSTVPPTTQPSNSTQTPEEEDEESDEDNEGSEQEEEGEEGDNNEEENDDEDGSDSDEDDDEEEEDEEEEADKSRKVLKKSQIKVTKVKRDVANAEEIQSSSLEHSTKLGSVIIPAAAVEERASEEEDIGTTTGGSVVVPKKSVLSAGPSSPLQGIPARSPSGEDDEIDIPYEGGSSVILSNGQ